jgi:multidrug resistance efflux pump
MMRAMMRMLTATLNGQRPHEKRNDIQRAPVHGAYERLLLQAGHVVQSGATLFAAP